MSAIQEDGDGTAPEPVKVLFTLHPGLDALDFIGPLEVLSHARHDPKDPGKTISFSAHHQSKTPRALFHQLFRIESLEQHG